MSNSKWMDYVREIISVADPEELAVRAYETAQRKGMTQEQQDRALAQTEAAAARALNRPIPSAGKFLARKAEEYYQDPSRMGSDAAQLGASMIGGVPGWYFNMTNQANAGEQEILNRQMLERIREQQQQEGRARGGRLLQDEYPTQYMPHVGRQVMQDGGKPDDIVNQALSIIPNTQPEPTALAKQVMGEISDRNIQPAMMPPPQQPAAKPIVQAGIGYQNLHPQLISQRLPTNKRSSDDPRTNMLNIDLDTAKRNRKAFEHNVDLVKEYGHLRPDEMQGPHDDGAERFINHVKDNLLFLHDAMPEDARNRAKLWYVGANKFAQKLSDKYNVPLSTAAAAIAAMSPQKDWFQNASLAERLLDIHHQQGNMPYTRDMEMTANRIFGEGKYDNLLNSIRDKSYGQIKDPLEKAVWLRLYDQTYNDKAYRELSPEGELLDIAKRQDGAPKGIQWGSLKEIRKGIDALMGGGERDLISQLMGERHKIRNFYNNILDPHSPTGDTTIDTHAVAAGLLRPLASNDIAVSHNFKNSPEKGFVAAKGDNDTGIQGTYPLYMEAYHRASKERGILPREMQSITWEAVRGLFPAEEKSEKHKELIDGIWKQYQNGEIDAQQARQSILDAAGGINAPSWAGRRNPSSNEEAPHSSYQRKLSEADVYGGPSGVEPGAGGGDPGAFAGLEESDVQKFTRHRQITRAARSAFSEKGETEVGLPQSYARRDGGSGAQDLNLGAPVKAVYSPQEYAKPHFEGANISAPDIAELSGPEGASVFHQAINEAKQANPAGASVYSYDPDEYANMRLFLTPDKRAGFALKGDDIVSVFNHPGSGMRNVSNAMLQLALAEGGRKLDAFDTELPHIYSRNKFRVISRMPFNDEYAPEGWDYKQYSRYNKGRPDVVFMAYDPTHKGLYDEQEGVTTTDYDHAVDLQNKAVNSYAKKVQKSKKADGGEV